MASSPSGPPSWSTGGSRSDSDPRPMASPREYRSPPGSSARSQRSPVKMKDRGRQRGAVSYFFIPVRRRGTLRASPLDSATAEPRRSTRTPSSSRDWLKRYCTRLRPYPVGSPPSRPPQALCSSPPFCSTRGPRTRPASHVVHGVSFDRGRISRSFPPYPIGFHLVQ